MPRIDCPAPDAPAESWLVYADALQADDDPLGELIVLNHAVSEGADPAKRDAHLEQHAAAILGPVAPHRANLGIAWRYGLAETVSVRISAGDNGAALVTRLLKSPIAASMRRLRLVALTPGGGLVDLSGAVAPLAEKLPSSCTELELVDERARNSRILVSADYDPGRNLVSFGSLDAVWAIRHLESLRLDVADVEQVQLGTIDAPALARFALLGLRWPVSAYDRNPSSTARTLAAARWPLLERLELRLPETITYAWPAQDGAYLRVDRYDEENEDYEDYEDYADDEGYNGNVNWGTELGPLLDALQGTPLEHLSLTGFATSRTLLEALQASGLPPKLKHLDLSGSNVSSGDVAWMLQHRPLFAQLQTLDLESTLIQDAAPLTGIGPEVRHSRGSGSVYQFSVGME